MLSPRTSTRPVAVPPRAISHGRVCFGGGGGARLARVASDEANCWQPASSSLASLFASLKLDPNSGGAKETKERTTWPQATSRNATPRPLPCPSLAGRRQETRPAKSVQDKWLIYELAPFHPKSLDLDHRGAISSELLWQRSRVSSAQANNLLANLG